MFEEGTQLCRDGWSLSLAELTMHFAECLSRHQLIGTNIRHVQQLDPTDSVLKRK